MSFLFDLHTHTHESSSCGRVDAKDVVERYIGLGYSGICITDHMNVESLGGIADTCEERAAAFLKGYNEAKKAAGNKFKVLLGMEIRFLNNDNDYLVYGFDEKFLSMRDFTSFKNLREFRSFADEHNLTVFQAHPFRLGSVVTDPDLLDGVEVYNGHGSHNSRNPVAYKWAQIHNKRMLSSSDFHYETGKEPGGIILEEIPEDSFELAEMLMESRYRLKIFEK